MKMQHLIFLLREVIYYIYMLMIVMGEIILINPSNGSSWSNRSVTFKYNVSDLSVNNFTLVINQTLNQTSSNVNVNEEESFVIDLGDNFYNWSVACVDNVNKENNSIEWELNVACTDSWSYIDWTPSTCPESQ